MTLFIYFILGVVLDIIITLHIRAVTKGQAVYSAALSTVITLISLLVIQHVIVSNQISLIFAYAAGTGIGTLAAMRMKRK